MKFPSCAAFSIRYTTGMTLHQWQTVAVVVDYTAMVASLWVEGQLQTKALPPCDENIRCETTMYMAKW